MYDKVHSIFGLKNVKCFRYECKRVPYNHAYPYIVFNLQRVFHNRLVIFSHSLFTTSYVCVLQIYKTHPSSGKMALINVVLEVIRWYILILIYTNGFFFIDPDIMPSSCQINFNLIHIHIH